MVDILDLPLEEDEDILETLENNHTPSNNLATLKLPEITKPKYTDNLSQLMVESENSVSADESKSRLSNVVKTFHSNKELEFMNDSYSNIFQTAVETLRRIIEIESENLEDFKALIGHKDYVIKNKKAVANEQISPELMKEYLDLKSKYRENLDILLSVRSGFSK